MVSTISGAERWEEPARKRQKLSPPPSQQSTYVENNAISSPMFETQKMDQASVVSQFDREVQAGILCFVNDSNPGFFGIMKQRYTDFLVNEITLDGKVVHLTDINPPQRKLLSKSSDWNILPSGETGTELVDSIKIQAETTVEPTAPLNPSVDLSRSVAEGTLTDSQPTSAFSLSVDDMALLDSYFGVDVRSSIIKLHERVLRNPHAKSGSLGSVLTDPVTDRQLRTHLHKDMRRIFNSRLETASDTSGIIKVTVAQKAKPHGKYEHNGDGSGNARNNQIKGKLGWQELGGEYLHFSLYKENKDTMEVISYISSRLKTSPKQFAFAGTKDRRGVTVQRVSVYRVHAESLANLNKTLYGSKIGNFQYGKNRLELGDLMGNEFIITLRDCNFIGSEIAEGEEKLVYADKVVRAAVENLKDHGFINYYGLQRFGTYSVGTDEVGKKILQGDFEGAVNAILAYGEDALASALNPSHIPADGKSLPRDDIARAHALHLFKTTSKSKAALEKMPRKFNGETNIIRYLNRNARDFIGALLQIPRNLRLMYVHAYQSLVWNMAASERWSRYGDKVVKGDLVLVDSEPAKEIQGVQENEVDENGEIIILPATGDIAASHNDLFQRARSLTAEEAESGVYSIFDIVLPTPGYDIEYPDNDIGDYYKEFMMSERGGGLDPGNMRRPQKDFSLSGSYRKLLAQIGKDVAYNIKLYSDDTEQMVETDLEKIMKSISQPGNPGPDHSSKQTHHAVRDHNARQLEAWKNLPSQLAQEDKAEADLYEAQKATEANLPKLEVAQPTYKDIFIQTSAEHGGRTGYRETTVVPGVSAGTPEAPAKSETAATGETNGKMDESAETEVSLREQPPSQIPNEITYSVSPSTSLDSDITPETKGLKPEHGDASPRDAMSRTATAASGSGARDESSHAAKDARQKIAVIVKFQLGSSQYATMALRELMKRGGVQTYKSEFGSGR